MTESVYVREQDKLVERVQRLERRALALERENETIRSRLANLEISRPGSTQVPEEPRKKPGRKVKKE